MTNREFFTAIINEEITPAVREHAESEIAKMDARNKKKSADDSKSKVATREKVDKVLGAIRSSTAPLSVDDLVAVTGLTRNQITSATGTLIKQNLVIKTSVKVDKKSHVVYAPMLGVTAE